MRVGRTQTIAWSSRLGPCLTLRQKARDQVVLASPTADCYTKRTREILTSGGLRRWVRPYGTVGGSMRSVLFLRTGWVLG
ncbi:hypothetical protein M407DRAFT_169138 [Tulasnella calospora MUT 4182]|uniref:Uncharacterized protein n=1 Tax=Tulasnella calospora MUT 4182 TaxID=1051891 RepID=A0A0C3K8C3_9AGAM|nr:hypothetical protein M407DRAFT_169138 [Tulasnella calospora MUT 4182]